MATPPDDLEPTPLQREVMYSSARPILSPPPEHEQAIEAFHERASRYPRVEDLAELIPLTIGERLYVLGEASRQDAAERPPVVIWRWENHLWPMNTLTIGRWYSHGPHWRAYLPQHTPLAVALRQGPPVHAILLRNGRWFAALEIDAQRILSSLYTGEKDPEVGAEDFLGDEMGGKQFARVHIHHPETAREHLIAGWVARLNREASVGVGFYRDPELAPMWAAELAALEKTPFAEWFKPFSLLSIHRRLDAAIWSGEWLSYQQGIQRDLSEAPNHRSLLGGLLDLAWNASSQNGGGLAVLSLEPAVADPSMMQIRPVVLDPDRLGVRRCQLFWERLPFRINVAYGTTVGPSDCPVDTYPLFREAPRYEGDPAVGAAAVQDLLREALALKEWTIPWGAYVQLDAGPFRAARLYELGQIVYVALVNEAGEYLLGYVDPPNNRVGILYDEMVIRRGRQRVEAVPADPAADPLDDLVARVTLGLRLLLAAIVRDFWVVEDRTAVFGVGLPTLKGSRLRSDQGARRVVYLPRIRYVRDVGEGLGPLEYHSRRPHFVTGHLRKAHRPSPGQIALAQRWNVVVPEGFTFVRPHRRGEGAPEDGAGEATYRSRSALRALQVLTGPALRAVEGRDAWFTFELNVKRWLEAQGYLVVHVAASRRGDGGVDIQAHRGEEHLFVQCKYWKARIGPAVVREMLGTLQTFPVGAIGLILTSSSLTMEARRLADDHGIRYLEGVNFQESLPDLKTR